MHLHFAVGQFFFRVEEKLTDSENIIATLIIFWPQRFCQNV